MKDGKASLEKYLAHASNTKEPLNRQPSNCSSRVCAGGVYHKPRFPLYTYISNGEDGREIVIFTRALPKHNDEN